MNRARLVHRNAARDVDEEMHDRGNGKYNYYPGVLWNESAARLDFEDVTQDEVGDRIELVGVCLMPKHTAREMGSMLVSGILSHGPKIFVGLSVYSPPKTPQRVCLQR